MPTSVVVCALCLFVGAGASARWLPDLDPGAVGGLALCVVSGLLGMALAVVGLHIYAIIELESLTSSGRGTLLAGELEAMLLDAGLLLGLALTVYLLAPRADAATRLVTDPLADPPAQPPRH